MTLSDLRGHISWQTYNNNILLT